MPVDVRRRLKLQGEVEMELEVDESQDAVVLRPAVTLRREDAWAYTPEHRASLERAHSDSAEGRVLEFHSEKELVSALASIQEQIRANELTDAELVAVIAAWAETVRRNRPDLQSPPP